MYSVQDADTFLKEVKSITDFEWIVKLLAKGFITGYHLSRQLHTGMEFQQYRPYIPGDDPRGIDWKLFAKSGKLYIRQALDQKSHQFRLLLDNSMSMEYVEDKRSKLLLAKIIAGVIAEVAKSQNDVVEMVYFAPNGEIHLGPVHHPINIYHIKSADVPYHLETKNKFSGIVVWITDLYLPFSQIEAQLKAMVSPVSEVCLFHLVGKKEINLDFSGDLTFVDLENGMSKNVSTNIQRKEYIDRLQNHFFKVENHCKKLGVWYRRFSLQDDLKLVLKEFFNHYNLRSI